MNLYKYRELNEFTLQSLKENYFWAPSKETLNDPCECYYSIEAYDTFTNFASLISPHVDKDNLNNQFHSVQNMIKGSGIFSLSKFPTIAPMWASYAGEHTGICIEYDLEDLIGKNKGFYQYFNVAYSDVPPDIGLQDFDGETALQKIIGTKSLNWKYEQEFRIICDNQGKNYHRSDAIRGIIFGLKTSDKSKNELMKLLSNRNINFKQLVNDGKSYSLHAQNIINPFDIKNSNVEKVRIPDHILPDKKYIKNEYKDFTPYLYKVAEYMFSYPDCIEFFDMDFSLKSTPDNPIIYVNFKEKGSSHPFSQKIFHIKEISL